jgi:hypothetical protein
MAQANWGDTSLLLDSPFLSTVSTEPPGMLAHAFLKALDEIEAELDQIEADKLSEAA